MFLKNTLKWHGVVTPAQEWRWYKTRTRRVAPTNGPLLDVWWHSFHLEVMSLSPSWVWCVLWPSDHQHTECYYSFQARPFETDNCLFLPSIFFPHPNGLSLTSHSRDHCSKGRGKRRNKEILFMGTQFYLWWKRWSHNLSECCTWQWPERSSNVVVPSLNLLLHLESTEAAHLLRWMTTSLLT